MAVQYKLLAVMAITLTFYQGSEGRGRLMNPPGRSSMWRFGFNVPKNYDDHALDCGGYRRPCGVCGDPRDGVRDNEAGGKYATGILGKTYMQGQVIDATVEVTGNIRGFFQFQLCAHNSPSTRVKEECLENNVLELLSGGTKYPLPQGVGNFTVPLRLPAGLTCTQCVLRWVWTGGNNWGVGPDGRGCLGCGSNQEKYLNCADIAITADGRPPISGPTTQGTTTQTPATTQTTGGGVTSTPKPVVTGVCRAANNWQQNDPRLDRWCEYNCKQRNYCPDVYCICQ